MSLKKKLSQRFIDRNRSLQSGARQVRKPNLELLEPRQMLSGISFTQDNIVENNTFQAMFGNELNENDDSQCYVILNIATTNGSDFNTEAVSILDSDKKEVKILSSTVKDGVASILAQYTLGDSYVFTVNNTSQEEGDSNVDTDYYVQFTLAGDLNNDMMISQDEYNIFCGEVQKGWGVNSRFISVFKNTYGVDISESYFDAIYDLEGNGKIAQNTFDTVIRGNYENGIKLSQKITVVPEIEDFRVNGKAPGKVEGEGNEFSFVTNETEELVLTGKTDAQDCELTFTTTDGKTYSGKIDLTAKKKYTFTNEADESDKVEIEYSVDKKDGFTLTFPKELTCSETLTLELWSDMEHSLPSNMYNLTFDTVEPAVFCKEVAVKGVKAKEDGTVYVKEKEFTLVVGLDSVAGTTLDAIREALENKNEGLYVRVNDKNGKEIACQKLDISLFNMDELDELTIEATELKLLQDKEGLQELTVLVTDLAGNVHGGALVTINILSDFTAPDVKVDGYTANHKYKEENDSMLVNSRALTLKFTPTDANGIVATVCKNNDQEVNVTEEKDGVQTYQFALKAGLNTITYTVTDNAGNSVQKTYLVYFSESVALSEAGIQLQNDGYTMKYDGVDVRTESLPLYDCFNYDSGLTFSASSSDTSIVKTIVNSNGMLDFDFQQRPEEGEPLSARISVVALNATGSTCVLSFTLNYVYEEATEPHTFWKDTKVENDYASKSLAKVEHIINQDSVTLTGKLTVPENTTGVVLDVYRGETKLHEGIDLTKASSSEDVEYTYDAESGMFTLQLDALDDGKYTFCVHEVEYSTDDVQITTVYVDTTIPSVSATMETEAYVAQYPDVAMTVLGTPSEQDKELGLWVEVFITNAEEETVRYAISQYDETLDKFSDLTYTRDSKWLKDGTYTLTIRTIDAAGNVYEVQESARTVTIDRLAPLLSIEGYEKDYYFEDEVEFDSMLVTESVLPMTVTVFEKNLDSFTLTNNDVVVSMTEQDGKWFVEVPLQYGLNTLVFTAKDKAGNEKEETCLVVWSAPPTISQVGQRLMDDGFVQAVLPQGGQYKTISLDSLFVAQTPLTYQIDIDDASWLNYNVSEDGILSFNYEDEPAENEQFMADVTIFGETENDESVVLTFTLYYIHDTMPPIWEDMILVNCVENETDESFPTCTNDNFLSIVGTFTEASSVASAHVYVQNMMDPSKNFDVDLFNCDENVATYQHSEVENQFSLVLKNLPDGVYTLTFYGSDHLGNASTVETGQNFEDILVKSTAPVLSATIAVIPTGTSTERVNENPTFNLTAAGTSDDLSPLEREYGLRALIYAYTTTPEDAMLYAQAYWDDENETFGDLEYLVDDTLTEGTWTFFVVTADITGNVSNGEETALAIEVVTTAPVIEASYEENYDSNNVGTYEIAGTEYDSMYLTDEDLQDGIYDLNVTVSRSTQTTVEMTLRYDNEGEESTITDSKIALQYGLNVIYVKATNDSGSYSEVEYKLWYNDMPFLTEEGVDLTQNNFYQIVNDDATEWRTLDLSDLVADEHGDLRYEITEQTANSGILASIDEWNILTFSYTKTPEPGKALSSDLCITVTDEFGEIVNLLFKAFYTLDDAAPKLNNVNVQGDTRIIENDDAENIVNTATNTSEIVMSGFMFDLSEIEQMQMTIYRGEEKILDALDMLQSDAGETLLSNVRYEYTFTDTDKTVELRLYNADNTPLQEGAYRIVIAGVDSSANDSISGEAKPQTINIGLNRTLPNVEATITLEKTGTSDDRVNGNPKFLLDFDDSTINDLWVKVMVDIVDYTGNANSVEYATGEIIDGNCNLEYKSQLRDGTYTFDFVVNDVAGNSQKIGEESVTIDRKIPSLSIQPYGCTFAPGKGHISNETTFYVLPIFAETDDTDKPLLYYQKDGDSEATLYDSHAGIQLDLEHKNLFYFWGQDTAGNRTNVVSITVFYEEREPVPAPEWKEDVPLTDGAYVWSNFLNEDGEYTLNLAELIEDSMHSTLAFQIETAPSVGDIQCDEEGVVTYTATPRDYLTDATGLNFKVSAVSTLEGAERADFWITLKIFDEEDIPVIESIELLSEKTELELPGATNIQVDVSAPTLISSGEYQQSLVFRHGTETLDIATITIATTSDMFATSLWLGSQELSHEGSSYSLTLDELVVADLTVKVTNAVGSDSTDICIVSSGQVVMRDESLYPFQGQGDVFEWDIEKIVEIYEDFEATQAPLEYIIPAQTFQNLDIEEVIIPFLPENHVIQSILLNDDDSFTVEYVPYQVAQDRSAIVLNLVLKTGETLDFKICQEYEKPFEVATSLTKRACSSEMSSLPTSVSTIDRDGATYYLNAWFRCTLPIYSEEFVALYATYALTDVMKVSVNADAVDLLENASNLSEKASREGANLVISSLTLNVKEMGGALLGADNEWTSLGQYRLHLTGAQDLNYSISHKIEFGFPFSYDPLTEECVGVLLDSVNNVQITGATEGKVSGTIPLEPEILASVFPTQEPIIYTDTLSPEHSVMFSIRDEAMNEGIITSNPVAVESYFENANEKDGCTTAVAMEIVDSQKFLSAIQATHAIQKTVEELTDNVFQEEDFYLKPMEE